MNTLPEPIYIIAGDHLQFQFFKNDLLYCLKREGIVVSSKKIIEVQDKDILRGIKNPWGYLVGTWVERKDLNEIKSMITFSDFIEVGYTIW